MKRNELSNLIFYALRNKSTKRILWKLHHKTNPRNESFENCVTKQIHETNLLKTRGFASPNPKDSDGFVYPIVLRIREDSLDSLDLSNLLKIASRNESAKRIFWKWLDSWSTIRNESFRVRICDPRYESNLFKSVFMTYESIRIHGFAKRIHVFMNILYDSRILTSFTLYNSFWWLVNIFVFKILTIQIIHDT
jgi:hypothetical protein